MTAPVFDRAFEPHYGTSIRLSPGIRRVVARNPSAFTFHGTGTYIVGEGTVAVIDPGPDDPAHLKSLMAALDGETVSAILITHTHRDHSPLAGPLKDLTDAPTYGFGPHAAGEDVEEGGDRDFVPDQVLTDGDRVSGPDWTLEAVHTPGHTSNHLCFAFAEEDALFSGDHVMGWSTSIVSPPDGDMAAYIASLRKLLTRSEDLYYPTHGNPISDAKRHVESFIAHRRDREIQILTCIARRIDRVADMVPAMYRDVPEHLHPAAARSVLAHLIHMTSEGRILCDTPEPTLRSRYSLRPERTGLQI
ncbi:MBL fold metallo-hydrolase [Rhodospirillaceae bacterium KN72]|uniref:MBL fold metallo-hydrolase n=1 Tax=Pacificispira spongiicola TaxID=2729598 RepID=A0A7Y0E0G8_9PROT|nr:MBL fold metallo-hydrolase [Pacificispira spongiicola]NMM44970.1 MBL fold metallo-hydrolase [Pacificispira spongiicola]